MRLITHILSAVWAAMLAISCASPARQFSDVSFFIEGKNSILTMDELRRALPAGTIAPGASLTMDITVFRYSLGMEKLRYDGSGTFMEETGEGEIKIMMKIRSHGAVKKVYFLRAAGTDKDEILKNLSLEIQKALGER